jgi:hypothetical protein
MYSVYTVDSYTWGAWVHTRGFRTRVHGMPALGGCCSLAFEAH